MKLDVSTRMGYDIAAALTSSGVPSAGSLKRLITGSIRRVCEVRDDHHCIVYPEHLEVGAKPECLMTRRIILGDVKCLRASLVDAPTVCSVVSHWLGHAVRAMRYLPELRNTWLYKFTLALCKVTTDLGLARLTFQTVEATRYRNEQWNRIEEMLK